MDPRNKSNYQFSEEKKEGLYDAIYKRRDVRTFLPDPVPQDVLARVLDAAHHAGSVGFMQPWNFLIIQDKKIREAIYQNFLSANQQAAERFSGEKKDLYDSLKLEGILECPINICVTCDSSRLGPHVLGKDTISETDVFSTCCAIQNLWLAARVEGLGIGWVSILNVDQLKKELKIPEPILPVAYLCLGYPVEFLDRPMLEKTGWAKRIPVDELIFYDHWGNQPEQD
jgi:5,6-dimethylbenzimidazole synthase